MSLTAADNLLETPNGDPEHELPHQGDPSGQTGWIWKVTALCLMLGFLLALSMRTSQEIRSQKLPAIRHGAMVASLSELQKQNGRLEQEIEDLRKQVYEFQTSRQDSSRASELLKEQLRDYKAMIGFAAVQGPGLKIELRDSPQPIVSGTDPTLYLVSEADVNGIISELRAAGAEAFAISEAGGKNTQRFVVTTTIRSAGRGVMVNGKTLRPPYLITAIGNPKDLRNALEMTEGIIQMRSLKLLKMITIEESDHLVLPAYSRSPHAQQSTSKG